MWHGVQLPVDDLRDHRIRNGLKGRLYRRVVENAWSGELSSYFRCHAASLPRPPRPHAVNVLPARSLGQVQCPRGDPLHDLPPQGAPPPPPVPAMSQSRAMDGRGRTPHDVGAVARGRSLVASGRLFVRGMERRCPAREGRQGRHAPADIAKLRFSSPDIQRRRGRSRLRRELRAGRSEGGFLFEVHNMCSLLADSRVGIHERASATVGYAWHTEDVSLGPSLSFYSMFACDPMACRRVEGAAPGGHAQVNWYFARFLGVSLSTNVARYGGASPGVRKGTRAACMNAMLYTGNASRIARNEDRRDDFYVRACRWQ